MVVGVERAEQPKPAKKTEIRIHSTPTSMHVPEKRLAIVSSYDVVQLRQNHQELSLWYATLPTTDM
jgi:hypothetical protein